SYEVMKINDQYALNFAGLGLIVQNAENVQNGNKDLFGKLSYVSSTVKTLLNPEHFDYKLTVDDTVIDGNTAMLVVANGLFIGGSRIPLTDLCRNGGCLNLFIFEEQSENVISDICKKKDSMNWNHVLEGVDHLLANKISIERETQKKVDIEGEIALKRTIIMEIIANAIKIFP